MTTAELLIEKGRKEGEKDGREKGKIEDAKNFLQLGVDLETVIKATGLSRDKLRSEGLIQEKWRIKN